LHKYKYHHTALRTRTRKQNKTQERYYSLSSIGIFSLSFLFGNTKEKRSNSGENVTKK